MMRSLSRLGLAVCLSTVLPLASYAETRDATFYAGLQFTAVDLDSNNGEGSNDDISSNGFGVLGGVEFGRYLALEANFVRGTESSEVSSGGVTADVGLENLYAVFAKAHYPIGENFRVYGRAGGLSVEYEVRDPTNMSGGSMSADDSGLAFGGGAEIVFGKNIIRLDFTEFNGDQLPTQSYTLAYARRF